MSPDELRAAIQAAGDDTDKLRAAVRAGEKSLEDAAGDHLGLAEVLVTLTGHDESRVRQDVADASYAFPDPFFGRVYDVLVADCNYYVKNAAQRAAERRAARRKVQAKLDAASHAYADVLDEIATKHGKGARRLAERAARRGVEDFVGRLYHEIARAAEPVQLAHSRLHLFAERGEGRTDLVKTAEERFAHLLGILKGARSYAKRAHPAFARESLRELVALAREHLEDGDATRERARAIAIDIRHDIELDANRSALVQALENVLKNALEATAAGGEVRVAATSIRRGAELELVVADGGAGMTTEQQARLFVPFASNKPGGTGVGLLTAKKMIEEVHNGELKVESEVGRGTRVLMMLPGRQMRSP